jgi:hypothetical protein
MPWLLIRWWELYGKMDAIYKFVTWGAHCWKCDDSSRRRVSYFVLILCNMHCLKGAAPSPNVQLFSFKICYRCGQSIYGMVPSAYFGRWAGDKRPIFVWFKIELQQMWSKWKTWRSQEPKIRIHKSHSASNRSHSRKLQRWGQNDQCVVTGLNSCCSRQAAFHTTYTPVWCITWEIGEDICYNQSNDVQYMSTRKSSTSF